MKTTLNISRPLKIAVMAVAMSLIFGGSKTSKAANGNRNDGDVYHPDGIELVFVSGRDGDSPIKSFYMGKYEVTQGQWKAIMGNNPSSFNIADNYPVENVNWYDAQEFLKRLSAKTGRKYRLPTEAEWEFAARGGNAASFCQGGCTYSGSNNVDEVANYDGNSGQRMAPVGSKKPNELGIYDMSGNVYEWCEDLRNDKSTDRVRRGGSYYQVESFCRVGNRDPYAPTSRISGNGFRVVLDPPPQEQWQGRYMWYPGQLSAFYQQQNIKLSRERCVDVGYPGKFFKTSHHAYFKRDVHLKEETVLQWAGPETVKVFVNGKEQSIAGNKITLPRGKSSLLFEVNTASSLPCIILNGGGIENPNGWQVSMDKINWTIPESSGMYNKPSVLPDDSQTIVVEVKPSEIFPLRNAELKGTDGTTIRKNGYVLVDFNHLEVGALTFHAKGKGTVTVRVGETPEEALERDEKYFEQRPIPPFHLSETGGKITVPERAFRYVSLECDDCAEISSIRFNTSLWPVEYQMQFESDDEYVNNLFKMGSATLHTNMHRFYLDGVKRDFLPWSMDAIVSSLAGDYLFGDQQMSKNGISIALMPLNPQRSDIGVPDYPLHALFGLKMDFLRFGDLTTSLQYRERIQQLLDFYMTLLDENGFLRGNVGTSHSFIPGWGTKNGPDGRGVAAYVQIMLYYNYETGAYFADLWKDKTLANTYRKQAQLIKNKLFEHFWDKEKNVFINGLMSDGSTDKRISHHAQYWAILADIFPKEHYDHLFKNILPNIPHYYTDISFEKGYEFLAYAKAGKVKELWDFLYLVWGDWMNQGHTRFPEHFHPQESRARQLQFYGRRYGLSLCHGANGAPPVVGVLNGLLGFSQSSAKTNEYTIKPEMLHLNWINARIPIKEGYIYLKLKAKGECEITVPANCTVTVATKNSAKPLVLTKSGTYTFVL